MVRLSVSIKQMRAWAALYTARVGIPGIKTGTDRYENGKITYQTTCEVVQFPVILAYAITIHKSQGMTYNKVGCDINKCFEPGQAYVALSRCTNLEGLYLLGKVSPHSLRVDSEVVEFYHYSFH